MFLFELDQIIGARPPAAAADGALRVTCQKRVFFLLFLLGFDDQWVFISVRNLDFIRSTWPVGKQDSRRRVRACCTDTSET